MGYCSLDMSSLQKTLCIVWLFESIAKTNPFATKLLPTGAVFILLEIVPAPGRDCGVGEAVWYKVLTSEGMGLFRHPPLQTWANNTTWRTDA